MAGKRDKDVVRQSDDICETIRQIFGFPIFSKGIEELLKEIEKKQKKKEKIWLATVNPEFVMEARYDPKFRNILNSTWLNVPDGVGIVWARRVLSQKSGRIWRGLRVGGEVLKGGGREDLIPGVELMDRLCQMAAKNGQTVYFFGGWENRAQKTAHFFKKKYPKLKVVGFKAENFDFKIETDFLFVAYGMRKQEEWIEANLKKLKVGLVMGVGRSFDYFSGELPRAPESWRQRGLEWLYSLFRQPGRWRRQLRLPQFIWLVLRSHLETEFPVSNQD